MNNIILKKDYDPGNGRIRKAGKAMRVDPATKKELIEQGIAESYTPAVQVIEKPQPKSAKATPKEVKKPAPVDLQQNF